MTVLPDQNRATDKFGEIVGRAEGAASAVIEQGREACLSL